MVKHCVQGLTEMVLAYVSLLEIILLGIKQVQRTRITSTLYSQCSYIDLCCTVNILRTKRALLPVSRNQENSSGQMPFSQYFPSHSPWSVYSKHANIRHLFLVAIAVANFLLEILYDRPHNTQPECRIKRDKSFFNSSARALKPPAKRALTESGIIEQY